MKNVRTNDLAGNGFNVVPSNTEKQIAYGLWVGTGGDLKVDFIKGGTAIILKNIPDGTFLPIAVKKIYSTDTDATDIVGLK